MIAWTEPRPPMEVPDLVRTDPHYRAVYEQWLAFYCANLDAHCANLDALPRR